MRRRSRIEYASSRRSTGSDGGADGGGVQPALSSRGGFVPREMAGRALRGRCTSSVGAARRKGRRGAVGIAFATGVAGCVGREPPLATGRGGDGSDNDRTGVGAGFREVEDLELRLPRFGTFAGIVDTGWEITRVFASRGDQIPMARLSERSTISTTC